MPLAHQPDDTTLCPRALQLPGAYVDFVVREIRPEPVVVAMRDDRWHREGEMGGHLRRPSTADTTTRDQRALRNGTCSLLRAQAVRLRWSWPRGLLLSCCAIFTLLWIGCNGASQEQNLAADKESIREMMQAYLPLLGEAYESGNIEILRPYVAEKEMASLLKRIGEFMDQEGRVIRATLQSFTVEDVEIWNYSNAFVTTLEVWDVEVLASGSDQVLSQSLGQRNRVKYQLKRRDDGWLVLHRQIEATLEK